MSALMRALTAESLKLRGTLALWMCLIAPATVVGLAVLQVAFADLADKAPQPPAAAWRGLATGMMSLWAFLMLPLFVTLESALLAGLEHANHRWRHLLALPLPRASHYLGKVIALLVLVAVGSCRPGRRKPPATPSVPRPSQVQSGTSTAPRCRGASATRPTMSASVRSCRHLRFSGHVEEQLLQRRLLADQV